MDYDPHLDPQLVWAGKKEHTSFEVPTVSLHVHETIDPRTIIEAVRRRNGNGLPAQPSLFERPEEKLPLRDAVDFYKHPHGWSNRLMAGDSLLIMNSLLEKEGMAGQVQMVYIDPPYGIKYGSNFQPFVNKRVVKDGKDEDLTQEPEMIRAFRDTWELGIHSYLTYLRDRILLARELLHDSGSVFVQISDENLHRVRDVMDEVFPGQFCGLIPFRKTGGLQSKLLDAVFDFLIWYAKDKKQVRYNQLFAEKRPGEPGATQYKYVVRDGNLVEVDPRTHDTLVEAICTHGDLTSQGNPESEYTFKRERFIGGFTFLPHEGGGDEPPPPPPAPKTRIEAMPERKSYEIVWPNVVRIDHEYRPTLALDLNKAKPLVLDAYLSPTLAELAPIIDGKPHERERAEIRLRELDEQYRIQKVMFTTAGDIYEQMKTTWKGNREYLLAQIIRIVERYIQSDKLKVDPPLFNNDDLRRRIVIALQMSAVAEHIKQAIDFENKQTLIPIFDTERPIRATGDMLPWYTGKPCEHTKRSHINMSVFDSRWEASEAFELDRNDNVVAWVRTTTLGSRSRIPSGASSENSDPTASFVLQMGRC